MTERISYIRDLGPKLIDNGYLVTEIGVGTKHPIRKGWTRPLSKDGCRRQDPRNGVGILCGVGQYPIVGIDVDFAGTEEESDALWGALYEGVDGLITSIYRVGRPPRFLLACRASEAGWTKGASRWFHRPSDPEGTRSRLEILGKGQQFVAYHTHPDTGKPYEYPWAMLFGEFSDTPVKQLPVLTLEGVDRLMEVFEAKMQEFGFVPESGVGESPMHGAPAAQGDAFLFPEFKPVGLTIEKARTLLEEHAGLYDVESYDGWRELGMRLHHEFRGSEEGLELYDEVSSKASSYKGFEDVRRKWMSFGRSTGRKVTMWPLAKAAGLLNAEELSERGLAERMIRYAGNSITVLRDTGEWLMFDRRTGLWAHDAESMVCGFFCNYVMDDVLSAEQKEAEDAGDTEYAEAVGKFRAKCSAGYFSLIPRVISAARKYDEFNRYRFSDFDVPEAGPFFLCLNGVVNLDTGDLTPNAPDRLLLRHAFCRYDPSAACPLWERSMLEWLGDADTVRYVQDVFGFALSGRRLDNIFLVLVGGGANGKSTFLSALQTVLGDYAVPVMPEVILTGRYGSSGGGPRPDVLALAGSRFVFCSETDDGLFMREADLKRFTGNDDVSVRGMYARNYTVFRPHFLPVLSTNHEPSIRGTDEAIWRRIRKIEFPFNFEKDPMKERDPQLSEKLKREAPGILNWLIAGYRRAASYPGGEVPLPESVKISTREYRTSQDIVGQWARESLTPDPKGRIPVKVLYQQFQADMKEQGETVALTKRGFCSEMRRLFGAKTLGKFSDGHLVIRGYRLKTEDDRVAEKDFALDEESFEEEDVPFE